jgi:hypothetical protein
MSLEKIAQMALENKPMEMKEAFEEEMQTCIQAALEEKYKKAMKAEADEDEDDEEDEDEDEDDDEDEDEDKK